MAFLIRNLQFYIQVIDVMHVVKVLVIVSPKKKEKEKKKEHYGNCKWYNNKAVIAGTYAIPDFKGMQVLDKYL